LKNCVKTTKTLQNVTLQQALGAQSAPKAYASFFRFSLVPKLELGNRSREAGVSLDLESHTILDFRFPILDRRMLDQLTVLAIEIMHISPKMVSELLEGHYQAGAW
jgi:hypothetical protein